MKDKNKNKIKTRNPYSLVIQFSSTEAAVGKGVRFYVCFNCTLHLFGHGIGGFLCHTARLARCAPGQLGRLAGADVLFSLFSGRSWVVYCCHSYPHFHGSRAAVCEASEYSYKRIIFCSVSITYHLSTDCW